MPGLKSTKHRSFRSWWEAEKQAEEHRRIVKLGKRYREPKIFIRKTEEEVRESRRVYMREFRRTHPRKDWHKDPVQNRNYHRRHMRDKRGQSYMNDIEDEAKRRNVTTRELKDALLRVVAEDRLFAALLD